MLSSEKLLKHERLEGNKSKIMNKSKKGFSLLEIVVSLGLIALFIIPMGNMVLGTVKINKAAENKQQASAVLQETVEYIRGIEVFPSTIGKYIDLPNEAKITFEGEDDGKKNFKVNKVVNDYGIAIEGTIQAEKIFSEVLNPPSEGTDEDGNSKVEVDYGKKNVAGAIYFTREKKIFTTNFKSSGDNDIKINDAINKDVNKWNEFSESDQIYIHVNNGGHSSIKSNDVNGEHYEMDNSKAYAILVIIDDKYPKLNITIESDYKKSGDEFKLYYYNKTGISTINDISIIDISTKGDKVQVVPINKINDSNGNNNGENNGDNDSTDTSKQELNITKYSVKLDGKKNNKILDSMKLDFIN